MKVLFASIISVAWIPFAVAQSFDLAWRTIDGGGGSSSGSGFTVHGTVGQADAGEPMTAGGYSITGGFWSFQSVAPSLPQLTIVPAGAGLVQVSWSPAAPGYVLVQSDNLDPASWSVAPSGTNNPGVIPVTGTDARFYTLGRQ